jgi:outer membrane protein TolC
LHLVLVLVLGALAAASPAWGQPESRLTLDELVSAAIRGPQGRAAAAATREARGARAEARGARYPSLRLLGILAPSPEIRCIDVACTETDPEDPTISLEAGVFARLELSLAQPLYTFGKLAAASGAGSYGVNAASSLEDATAGEVAVRAAEAYYGLKLARESLQMLEEGRDRVAAALQRINSELEAGSGDVTLQDRYRLETLAAEVDFRLATARSGAATALAGVRALSGRARADLDPRPLEPIEIELSAETAYVERARQDRPEVRAAEAGKRAAHQLAELEAARYFPDLLLVGSVTLARATGVDPAPSAFADDPYNTASAAAALALRWELDPFAHHARVERARARARRAEHLSRAMVAQAGFQARAAHAELIRTRDQLAVARRGEKSARAWLAATLQGEAVGTVESKELADAYLAYFTARARTLEAIHGWNLAVFRLRQATGEFEAARNVQP